MFACILPQDLLAATLSAKTQGSVGGELVDGGVEGDEEGEAMRSWLAM